MRYGDAGALSPESQRDLENALRDASLVGPVGLVFVVDPSVQVVDHDVPEYWLGITGDARMRIAAIAVVTPNPAVAVATRGFSASNILRNVAVTVRPFAEEEAAVAWVNAEVTKARGGQPPKPQPR